MPGQHDYEPQPEAPDLGASVQLESSESLVAPPGDRDALDAGYVAADRPYLLDEDRLTASELSEPETLDERLSRERPDVLEDPEAVVEVDTTRSGRITPAAVAVDTQEAESLTANDIGIDGGAASAEEAAMHILDEDPGDEPKA